MKKTLNAIWALGLLGLTATAAYAQGPLGNGSAGGYRPGSLLEQVISTLVFSGLGIVLAIVGFKLFDMVIPFNLEKEICEKNNIAVSILAAAMILGVCIIVSFVVAS